MKTGNPERDRAAYKALQRVVQNLITKNTKNEVQICAVLAEQTRPLQMEMFYYRRKSQAVSEEPVVQPELPYNGVLGKRLIK